MAVRGKLLMEGGEKWGCIIGSRILEYRLQAGSGLWSGRFDWFCLSSEGGSDGGPVYNYARLLSMARLAST